MESGTKATSGRVEFGGAPAAATDAGRMDAITSRETMHYREEMLSWLLYYTRRSFDLTKSPTVRVADPLGLVPRAKAIRKISTKVACVSRSPTALPATRALSARFLTGLRCTRAFSTSRSPTTDIFATARRHEEAQARHAADPRVGR